MKFKFTYEIILQYVYPLFKVVQGNTITKVNILASSRQIGIRYRQPTLCHLGRSGLFTDHYLTADIRTKEDSILLIQP